MPLLHSHPYTHDPVRLRLPAFTFTRAPLDDVPYTVDAVADYRLDIVFPRLLIHRPHYAHIYIRIDSHITPILIVPRPHYIVPGLLFGLFRPLQLRPQLPHTTPYRLPPHGLPQPRVYVCDYGDIPRSHCCVYDYSP